MASVAVLGRKGTDSILRPRWTRMDKGLSKSVGLPYSMKTSG